MAADYKENYNENTRIETDENWIRCKGNCFQTIEGQRRRCESYGHHEWCCNYMVNLNMRKPEFFEVSDR